MVATYTIAGRQIGSHVLAMLTLGTAFSGAFGYSKMSGGKKEKAPAPPINATSEEEEKFIKEFLQSANMDEIKETTAKQ